MNKERSEWALKNKQNELAYQVTDAYYKLILEKTAESCFRTKPVE